MVAPASHEAIRVKRAWSPAAEDKLRALYATTPLPRLAFLLKRTEPAIRSRAKLLGLTRGNRMRWTNEQLSELVKRYPDDKTEDIARDMGRILGGVYQQAQKMGLKKSDAYMASDRSGRVQRGKQHPGMKSSQFKPGQAPANKGLRRPGWAPGRMAETQFAKGRPAHEARNYQPIGSERITSGVLLRKVTDDSSLYPARRWVPVARLVWEEANGPIPPGHAVVFKPGRATTERQAITPDSLELLSRGELMKRNTRHNYPPELNALLSLKAALTRRINRRTKELA